MRGYQTSILFSCFTAHAWIHLCGEAVARGVLRTVFACFSNGGHLVIFCSRRRSLEQAVYSHAPSNDISKSWSTLPHLRHLLEF